MLQRARIYKKNGIWITDVWMSNRGLMSVLPLVVLLKDGISVARWTFDTWVEARDFIFG